MPAAGQDANYRLHLSSDAMIMSTDPSPAPPPVRRRVFHLIAASATTLLALAIPPPAYLTLIGAGALLALALDSARPRAPALNRLFLRIFGSMLKPAEVTEISGATWFLIAAFFAFHFYGPAVAVPALLFIAVGDPAAAIVGVRSPGPRWWGKSPVGGLGFITAALAAWAALCALGLGAWSWGIIAGAIIAAAVELAPIPLDDNLTVPLISGGAITLVNMWTA